MVRLVWGALFIYGDIKTMKQLGEKLKKERAKTELTQKQVADLLGIERSTYTKYESGTVDPPLDVLYKISLIYRVSADELISPY